MRTTASRRRPLWVGGAFVLALAVLSRPTPAATFAVDNASDAADALPGDGVCAAASGRCTLRAAIHEANARPRPDQMVLTGLPATGILTIALSIPGADENTAATGDLDITDDLDLDGGRGTGTTTWPTEVDGGVHDFATTACQLAGRTLACR
jgi:hypothetical protein